MAEYLFGEMLSDYIKNGTLALSLAFLWRLISYYPYLIIGMIILPRWIGKKKIIEAEQKLYVGLKLIHVKFSPILFHWLIQIQEYPSFPVHEGALQRILLRRREPSGESAQERRDVARLAAVAKGEEGPDEVLGGQR